MLDIITLLSYIRQEAASPCVGKTAEIVGVPRSCRRGVYSSTLFRDISLIPLRAARRYLVNEISHLLVYSSLCLVGSAHRHILIFSEAKGFHCRVKGENNTPGRCLRMESFLVGSGDRLRVLSFGGVLQCSLANRFVKSAEFSCLSSRGLCYGPSFFMTSPVTNCCL